MTLPPSASTTRSDLERVLRERLPAGVELRYGVGPVAVDESIIDLDDLARLRTEADRELADPGRWGTTLTLAQSWARVP